MKKEEILAIMTKKRVQLVGTVLVSSGTTFFVTVGLLRSAFKDKYERIAAEEIAEARLYYEKRAKEGVFADPETAAENLLTAEALEALREYQGKPIGDLDPEEVLDEMIEPESIQAEATIVNNIFMQNSEDELPVVVLPDPEEGKPQIISEEEFMHNETDYIQSELSYFEEDDVLADEREQPIPDVEQIVGLDFTEYFGVASGNKDVVHVRNVELEREFEITRSKGSYAKEVLGFIEHSQKRPLRKMRRSDDE